MPAPPRTGSCCSGSAFYPCRFRGFPRSQTFKCFPGKCFPGQVFPGLLRDQDFPIARVCNPQAFSQNSGSAPEPANSVPASGHFGGTEMKRIVFLILIGTLGLGAPASAAELQGKSLLGEPLYITQQIGFPPGQMENLLKATAEAKTDFEKSVTPDTATWYARLLMYQNHILDSIAVLDRGLKQYPTSGKLLRHRAQRYLTLREFDKSIADGLAGVKYYEGQPIEREKPGPAYFPGDPDMVQMYLHYHLGQA